MKALLGKKVGMTRVFDDYGDHVAVTIIQAGPCYISQIKTEEMDGYNALQLGFEETSERRVGRPLSGHFAKAGVKPLKHVKEFKVSHVDGYELGQEITVEAFVAGESVNVTGTSKGKGFAGVMKRHDFAGAQTTHGQSDRRRAPGSIGNASDPSRVFPGKRMAGRMGNDRVKVQNLTVVRVDAEKNLIYITGSIPGSKNSIVEIEFNG